MSSAASVPAEGKPLSEVERVVDTFIAPRKTFTDIRRSASWWLPFVLMVLASFALVSVVDKKLGMEKVVENQMALSPKQAAKLDQLPPDQRASQMESIVKLNRMISYAYPVLALIFAVIIAAVLLATFNFGFGAELKFNQCLAVTLYSWLPGILKALIAILAVSDRRSGRFHLPEPGGEQPRSVGGPQFSFSLRGREFTRPVHDLDARAGGNRVFLPDQGQTRHLHGGRLWLVGDLCPGRSRNWGSVCLRRPAPDLCRVWEPTPGPRAGSFAQIGTASGHSPGRAAADATKLVYTSAT